MPASREASTICMRKGSSSSSRVAQAQVAWESVEPKTKQATPGAAAIVPSEKPRPTTQADADARTASGVAAAGAADANPAGRRKCGTTGASASAHTCAMTPRISASLAPPR